MVITLRDREKLRFRKFNQARLGKLPEKEGVFDDKDKIEPLLSPLERARLKKAGTTQYLPEYAKAAFELLSSTNKCRNKTHVCRLLQCSKPTLLKWMRHFPEFKKAIEDGMEIGQSRFRDKIRQHAFEPTKDVNNGLIKLLANNVYGIKEEKEITLTDKTKNTGSDAVKLMKERGIPIPDIEVDDIKNIDE